MKTAEIRNLTEEELRQKLNILKEELFKLNIQRKMGRVEKPHMIGELRKDVARINTILKERKKRQGYE
jgi:large subunit ribosomal protein L29